MALRPNMKLAALGGPNTFGGDAARRLRELYPEFSEIVYFRTAEEAFAFAPGGADAGCAPQQMARTGVHPGIQAYIHRPGSQLYVIAEVEHAYHCSLLARPGTTLGAIRRVLGHTGSVTQSRPWLSEHLPQATIEIVDTSSMGAAQTVAEGDGSIASVGTPGMARQFGLVELGKEIDGGSVGAYWAISPHRLFSAAPTRLVVTGRIGGDGRLADLVGAIAQSGFRLQTCYQVASGLRLYEYDSVLRFAGKGSLATVQQALSPFPMVRLAGAFETRQ